MRRVVVILAIFWMVAVAGELNIPKPLQEWRDWVMYGVDDLECPDSFNGKNSRECLWYESVKFDPQSRKVEFYIQNFSSKAMPTPLILADSGWVESVKIDEVASPIFESGGTPHIKVPKGLHLISFQLLPKGEIKYLKLPERVVALEVLGKGVLQRDKNSRVWLKQKEQKLSKNDKLEILIYRKIVDSHPMRVDTHLHFRVLGGVRYVNLKGILLDGFLAESIQSRLKASISKDDSLKVELKAGEWDLTVKAYSNRNISTLKRPKYNFTPANSEIWVFQDNPKYRTVRVEGAKAIDPSQSDIPKAWKRLGAYLIDDKTTFKIVELYKTKIEKESNRFKLTREVWLDFNGSGYSIFDRIDTTLNSPTRLEALGEFNLLSLSIDGKAQVISSIKKGGTGVELRQKSAKIDTSARYEGNPENIPVNGWNQKLNSSSLVLNLPPAWRVLGSSGSDRHSTLWIDKWNLLDIFLLLLLSTMINRLFGLKWAILTFISGVIFWQEPEAPKIIWILLALFVALLRVVPDGKLRKFITILTIITIVRLLFVTFDFTLFQLRASLYPQLEKRVHFSSSDSETFGLGGDISPVQMDSVAMESKSIRPKLRKRKANYQVQYQRAVNVNEKIQTGIAKPSWVWSSYNFYWSGTVSKTQKLNLWLVPPPITRVWRVLSIFGVLLLLFVFVKEYFGGFETQRVAKPRVMAIFLALFFAFSPSYSKSPVQTPPQDVLNQLKSRIIESSKECKSASCASIEKMKISADESGLKINMQISCSSNLYIPTLERLGVWVANSTKVDGNSSTLKVSDKRGNIYLYLQKGVHQVELLGSLEGINRISLESKLPIRVAESESSKGWQININSKHFIEVLRVLQTQKIPDNQIAPFVSIHREFHFENSWYVITTASLLNSTQKPYILKYPLLDGESVIDQNIKTKEQKAIIYLTRERRSKTFKTILPIRDKFKLKAYQSKNREIVFEEWLLDAKSSWHIDYEGLEPVGNSVVRNRLLPKFKPWMGESLTLKISKTTPKKGATLTVKYSKLSISQSNSYRDLELKLKIKSAIATKHPITIKNLKELKSIKIDGKDYYLKPKDGKLELPLRGGEQSVIINWREKYSPAEIYDFPTVDLNISSTNSMVELNMPYQRWILYTGGTLLGPAVLIWGVMLAILIFAYILSRTLGTPPTMLEWALLGLGITTISPWGLLPIVIWILLLKFKAYRDDELKGRSRNFVQAGIVIFTILSLVAIIFSISISLLSNPEMLIRGNGSSSYHLIWYKDYIDNFIFKPTTISLSLWYYKVLMLFWSLWVSFKLIGWIESGWRIFSSPPIWTKKEPKV